jgi:hypothetical protein
MVIYRAMPELTEYGEYLLKEQPPYTGAQD